MKTVAGKVFFDGVNVDVAVSHEILVRYDPSVTSETWILLKDGRRLDVVNVEDLEGRHEYLRLLCNEVTAVACGLQDSVHQERLQVRRPF